ncbi:MAG: DNA polymerase III subunit alpha [Chitinophagales bacterium]|nr:DNA polymerase III subunit alpha [Chitinophagales bacterium]MBP8754864.1 DNA polymerase III subunit alpha [Chitinophagales bacterium]
MYLNTHSYYSLRYGTLSIQRLLAQAEECGIKSFALTDINNTSGWFELLKHARNKNIHVVPGIDFRNDDQQLYIGIAKNHDALAALNRFLSEHLLIKKALPEIAPHIDNTYFIYPFNADKNYVLEENDFIGVRPEQLNRLKFSKYKSYTKKLVALNPVSFGGKKDHNAHRILQAINHNTIITKLDAITLASPTEIFYNYDQLKKQFEGFEFLLKNAENILADCQFDFEFGVNKNKLHFTGNEKEDIDLLLQLTFEGVRKRYGKVNKTLLDRVNKELDIVIKKGFVCYFLINWDLVEYARRQGYFCIGRGSGANSLIAYCLRITDVDPIELDLYFERFINLFRETPPDFDIDFSWKDRNDVTEYIFNKYTHEHTALLGTYSEFKEKSFIREVAKTFGLPKNEIDALIKLYGEENFNAAKIPDRIAQSIYNYGEFIYRFPNMLSIHSSGILISEKPIYYYSPTYLPPKGFPTVQFDMYVAEDIGLYKFDILSQRGLGHIKDTIQLVKENKNIAIDISQTETFKKDPLLNKRLSVGDAIGCFYIESPAMRTLLCKLKTSDYLNLVAASSIIRPGVARSGMMRTFIQRHRFPESRKDIHQVMGNIMPDTYGVMVYQEDVIKVAHHFAKLTLSEADVLRRGMSGKYRSKEEFQRIREKYFENCRSQGYTEELMKDVWHQIESFAGYSFAKGHSASYAVESYQSLYLKTYYPHEFMVGVINNFGGFFSTELYVHEAKMQGAKIEAPCVNLSYNETVIYGDTIYLGFQHMQNFESKVIENILHERLLNGSFKSLDDFLLRVEISLEQLEILIQINAFRFTEIPKHTLLIEAYMRLNKTKKTSPAKELFPPEKSEVFQFPELFEDTLQNAWDEIQILGFPLTSPFALIANQEILNHNLVNAVDLEKHIGKKVEIVAYYVTRKYTATIKGDVMYFGTFVDIHGHWLDTIHFPPVAKKYRFQGKCCYHIKGKVVDDFGVYSVEVEWMQALTVKTPQYI